MKSEKAQDILSASSVTDSCGYEYLLTSSAQKAVEIAEREAEERMRAKAHKIVKEMMGGIFQGDMPQKIADEFIQKLNEA